MSVDLTAKKFGKLVALEYTGRSATGSRVWLCLCECGNKAEIRARSLTRATNPQKSCGCIKHLPENNVNFKHGHASKLTGTYRSWKSMWSRCRSNDPRWGGRGIVVCSRWENYLNFFADMGERPDGQSIDRINNNGNYEPQNCKWSTAKEQNRNKRNSRHNATRNKKIISRHKNRVKQ